MPVQSKMAVEPKLSEPIAIVGTSCRFAGIATTPSKLWELLCQAPDLSRKAPADRFNIDAFYHKDGEYHGTTNSTKAYWLEQDVKCFDTGLFNITPNEAEAMDPQQRLLLEVVYEAMESAGFPLSAYSGKEVGVYSGCMTQDYETLSARDELTTSQYFATGNSRAIMANRVSYFFNFNGPSMTIDTACSSSLVALNLAMLALRAGECKMACVTGANLMLTPEQFIVESSLHMLSPVGKCHMWDVKADGYARGEGVAALIIKTLSQALADGDKIEGIIREVGVNADGKTSGITMPNSSAQAALIRSTYQRAGLDPSNPVDRCQYFEAHGTGTAAGDPREAAAIHEAFFDNGDGNREAQKSSTGLDKKEMLVGSIKTVIGHTEAAAGLAGVLKVMASMKHGFVPPNLHFNTLNPSVKPFYKHLQIPTVTTRWPEPALGQPRRASVNSFGFGGANAHAIIEAYDPEIHGGRARQAGRLDPAQGMDMTGPIDQATTASGVLAPPQLNGEMSGEVSDNTNGKTIAHRDSAFSLPVVISAASIKSLRDVAQTYKAYLEQNGALDIRQLSWHQYARRTGLPYRVTFSAATTAKALQELNILLRDTAIPNDRLIRGKATKSSLRILGVFTGQGAQWAAMSKALLQQNKVYRETIMRLDAVLQTCPNPCTWKLAEQIMAGKETSRIQEAAVSQPLCTAVQIGLVDVMRSIGIDFHTVVGHSSGEIAAAYAAGKISAADAIVISYYRGTVAHLAGGANGQKGGMLAAGLSESEALSFCDEPIFEGRICVAASNAPNSVTLSGDLDAIHMANNELEMRQKFSRVLFVDTAYHSPHMTAPSVAYIQAMREYGIKPIAEAKGAIWISSVGGRPRTDAQDLDCQYWSDNMVNQVQFHDAVQYLLSQPGNDFDCAIEIGPHPALQGPTIQTAKDLGRTLAYTCPLNRSKDASLSVAEFLGFMWSNFECDSVDLRSYIEQSGQQQHVLESRLDNVPPYPFDHAATHWRESRVSRQYHFKTDAPHELLGSRSRDDNAHELMWRNLLKLDKIPWLEHHSFQGQALLPASAYCVMALDAARFFLAGRPASLIELRDIEIFSGIALDRDSPGVETLFTLNIASGTKETSTTIDASFALYSCSADGSTKMKKHASGLLTMVLGEPFMGALPERELSLSETLPADSGAFYEMMTSIGLSYTGPFKALTSIERRYGYCSAVVDRFHKEESTTMDTSPATLDACFQCAFLSYSAPGDGSLWAPFLPTRIGRIQFNLAVFEGHVGAMPNTALAVDTHTTHRTSPLETPNASISVDLTIFNEQGVAEIQVEDLTVRAIANTNAKDDLELYLHTVMDVDPTDEIVPFNDSASDYDGALLAEHCCRVTSYYLQRHLDPSQDATINPWLNENEASIDTMIRQSKYAHYLQSLRRAVELEPQAMSMALPFVLEEARHVAAFQAHIGRMVKQIAHRFAWMDILCLESTNVRLSRPILAAVGSAFQSFTVGLTEELHSLSSSEDVTYTSAEGVQMQNVTLTDELKEQMGTNGLLDLVIVPTTLLNSDDAAKILTNISQSMKPGGFLIMVNQYNTMLHVSPTSTERVETAERPPTPPQWPDVSEACGFVQQARKCDQFHGAGCVFIRQLRPSVPARLSLATDIKPVTRQLLLIRGSCTHTGDTLVPGLEAHLGQYCERLVSRSLEEATKQDFKSCTAAVVLADVDEPIMSNMTEHLIDQLRSLMRPTLTVLWVTADARGGSPDHAASFGFLRTIAAEVPTLHLQALDLDPSQLESQAETVSFAFYQMSLMKGKKDGSLSIFETEIHMDKGRRLISRVLPWKNANDRVNAERRLVTRPVNTLRQCTEAVFFRSANGTLRFEVDRIAHDVYAAPPPGETTIQVEYSSALPFKAGEALSGYVCIGRKWKTGTRLLALSATNSSYITCPLTQTVSLEGDLRPSLMILHQFIRHLANITAVLASTPEGGITLVDPDVEFTKCLSAVLASDEELHREVVILQTNSGKADESLYANVLWGSDRFKLLFLHPRTTMRDLKKIFTRGTCVFNFAADDTDMSQRIAAAVAENGTYHSAFDMFNAGVAIRSEAEAFASVKAVWQIATAFINKDKDAYPYSEPVGLLSLNELRHQAGFLHPFQIIDWKSDRDTQQTVHHLVATQILSPDKTYLMFGMTRDSGHSICRFLLEQGAKTVVLASRNPVMDPNWVATLSETYRADIRIAKADVTKIDSLFALKSELLKGMPPVGGIINGAMVLDDRVFDQMTLETWNRVLHPKSIGSSNLDLVFDDHDLEFFIMTSSFAAIGGHSGQSNYAAANMYMNGIAANRRARGLAATALNIGVIYGLGFLQREKTDLYAGLERDGYLPISEHSLHHMFLEAIAAGRPSDDDDEAPHPYSITTGLRRFQRGLPDPLFWQMDPRFGHFAMRDSAEEDGPTTTAQKSLMEEIAGLDEDKEAIADAIGAGLDRRLQVLLQLPAGAIDHNNNLQGMGVDSLAAVEVRNWFHKHLAKDVAVMKILDTPSIRILCLELAEQVLVDRAEQEEESK